MATKLSDKEIEDFKERLIVGAKIKIGKRYSALFGLKEGETITLIEGTFENDNGLYTEYQKTPSVWDKSNGEFDSIYHLFGNKFEHFLDCEIL